MKIWVDADACPKTVKDVLFRAAERTETMITFVSNKAIYLPASPFIKSMVVSAGFDVADQKIVDIMEGGDLVITADIPLANAVIEKKGFALDPRGELYNSSNIKLRLSLRNLSEELRSIGVGSGGPDKLGKRELQAFANSLDRFLAANKT